MKSNYLFTAVLFIMGCIMACTYEKVDIIPNTPDSTGKIFTPDEILFNLSNGSDFQYYKNSPDTLTANNFGAHLSFVRIKFNAKARSVFDASGKLPAGGSFPDSSVVVKEIYDSKGGPLKKLAIMQKLSGNANASSGWLWGEYNANGSAISAVTKKGSDCVSCHQGSSRDFVYTFEQHP